MELNRDTKILIVGLGLIGGSYAQALTDRGYEVGALDQRSEAITYAMGNGMIRHGRSAVEPDYIRQFDLIVFALYPHVFLDWLRENQQWIKRGALLTDVTGVKSSIVSAVQDMLRSDLEYIGAHPMAGREVSGVENAKKEIFQGANYIVTPTERNSEAAIAICKQLGHTLGFRTITTLTPEKHDQMIGFLSQLTHCIAVSLMVCADSEGMASYTGDSFRELTRIAKINDEMWSELFLLNKKELLEQMNLFEEAFIHLRDSIARDDTTAIREMMRLSTQRREYFDREEERA